MSNNILILGHRANYPEILDRYYSEGVDGVEIDIRDCEGVLCLRHGLSKYRRGVRGFFERLASKLILGDLWTPYKLDDLYDRLKGIIVLDIKEKGLEERLLDKFGAQKNVFYTSFKWDVAVKIRKLNSDVNVGIITTKFDQNTLDFVIKNDLNTISSWHQRIKFEILERAVEQGIKIFIWTLDNPKKARFLAQKGIFGIITNKPSVIIKAIKG